MKKIILYFATTTLFCAALLCGGGKKPATPSLSASSPFGPVAGTWSRTDSYFKTMLIDSLGGYRLVMANNFSAFEGKFEHAEGRLIFVDTYCGWKFPGIYEYTLKGTDTLVLTEKEDRECDRYRIIPGTWYRGDFETIKERHSPPGDRRAGGADLKEELTDS